MPTYEYSCKKCGQTLEVFQSFSDKPLRKHQECGGDLQKVFHARGVVFKGSGFYSTDYGRASRRGGSKDGDGGDAGGKKEGKTESKPSESKAADTT